jgi:hypothetical protein
MEELTEDAIRADLSQKLIEFMELGGVVEDGVLLE